MVEIRAVIWAGSRARLLGVATFIFAIVGHAGGAPETKPLWPGSSFTTAQRNQAVARGLDFIYRTAAPEKSFEEYASDYLWCFYTIAEATTDPGTRRRALEYGRELARRWRSANSRVPPKADADMISELTMSLEASEKLGVGQPALRVDLEKRIPDFSAADFLAFDAKKGPPPNRVITLRGEEACTAAGIDRKTVEAPETDCPAVKRTIPDYDTWYDALITVYFGDRFGVPHGATFADLMRWRSALIPYPDRAFLGEDAYYDLVYLVTHLVYTHNDYNLRRLEPAELPREYAFIRRNLPVVMADGDAETYAELVESLRSFGHTPKADPEIAAALTTLMASQNEDGSWGEAEDSDVYNRYHATWTAISALIDCRFAGEKR